MSDKQFPFQPGVILYDVILGLLRARGITFDKWCAVNNVAPSSARNALFGQSKGKPGRELIERIINSAGREAVRQTYAERVKEHSEILVKFCGNAA